MQNFFYLCEHHQIRASAYEYLLSLCDKASYLYGYRTDDKFDFEFEAAGTPLEGIIGDIIKKDRAQSWGMSGAHYSFSMSDRVRAIITEYGLGGIIPVTDKKLENLSLYGKDKILYSVCSHEGYTSIDDEFEKKISKYCLKKAVELPLYKELNGKFAGYSASDLKELDKSFTILAEILNYVMQSCKAVIYNLPVYEIEYEDYLSLAEKFLSDDCVKILRKYKNFDELHPAGYAKTFAESDRFINVPGFQCSEIFIMIMEQLDILKVVWYNHGIDPFSEKEEIYPTIVIADK
ncbi:MAG: hypothetical protein J1G05_05245 [Clostridiales bacterium]|nr:hypothetical protein [Clostridiales bacterium]